MSSGSSERSCTGGAGVAVTVGTGVAVADGTAVAVSVAGNVVGAALVLKAGTLATSVGVSSAGAPGTNPQAAKSPANIDIVSVNKKRRI